MGAKTNDYLLCSTPTNASNNGLPPPRWRRPITNKRRKSLAVPSHVLRTYYYRNTAPGDWDLDRFLAKLALRIVVPILILHLILSNSAATTEAPSSLRWERPSAPLPSSDIKVSAIVMNHDRPYLLKHSTLLRTLAAHPSISEVLVLHSKPDTAFDNRSLKHQLESPHLEKLRHMDVQEKDKEIGLALRFHYCAQAVENQLVMIVDDDMELDSTGVSELVLEMEKNSKRIVGHYGRAYNHWDVFGRHGYSTWNVYGNVEVVLTKVMILERAVCTEFGKYRGIVDDMVQESTPKWNGEDIFVNLVANRLYGVPSEGPYKNYAIPDLPVWEAQEAAFLDEISVSGNMDRTTIWKDGVRLWWKNAMKAQAHTNYRGRLWQTAKRRLTNANR